MFLCIFKYLCISSSSIKKPDSCLSDNDSEMFSRINSTSNLGPSFAKSGPLKAFRFIFACAKTGSRIKACSCEGNYKMKCITEIYTTIIGWHSSECKRQLRDRTEPIKYTPSWASKRVNQEKRGWMALFLHNKSMPQSKLKIERSRVRRRIILFT